MGNIAILFDVCSGFFLTNRRDAEGAEEESFLGLV